MQSMAIHRARCSQRHELEAQRIALAYALPGRGARERSKSRSFGNSVRTCSLSTFANSRVSQKRKTASNTRPGPRNPTSTTWEIATPLRIFEAQDEFSRQPYPL